MTDQLRTILSKIDHVTWHNIIQDLTWGLSPMDVARERGVPLEAVIHCLEHDPHFQPESTPRRKALALARIDLLGKVCLEQGATARDMGAIRTWVELQKREAALTGMDQPTKQQSEVKVTVSWLQPGRLAYKDGKELASDIASRPVLPPPTSEED